MPTPSGDDHRRSALRALSGFTIPLGVALLVVNIRVGALPLVAVNGILLLTAGTVFLLSRREIPLQGASLAFLAAAFLNIVVTLAAPGLQPGTSGSLALIPVLAYLLLDVPLALPVTATALGAAAAAYFVGALRAGYRLNPLLSAHVFVPVVVLFILSHWYARSRIRSVEQMLDHALRDPLTRLWNREKLLRTFDAEAERMRAGGMPLALILIDLDDFKQVNDRHGHDAGDAALVFFAKLMMKCLRKSDLGYRIGGEEFAILLRGTDSAGAVTAAEHLRSALEAADFRYRGRHIHITLSAGVAELGSDGEDWLQLYRTADARLYACKARGRNCVLAKLDAAA